MVRSAPGSRTIVLSILSITVMAGCASFRPDPIAPNTTAAAFLGRDLDDPGLRRFVQDSLGRELPAWPPSSWDLQLLTLAALYYHPDLDVARAKWGVANAAVITAGARPNPTVGLSAQYNADAPANASPWSPGLILDVPVETAGKRGYRIEQAQYLSEAARLEINQTAWRVRSRVRSSVLGLSSVEPQLTKQADLQSEMLRLMERRLAVGAISQPELTSAQIALNQVKLALLQAQRQRAENRAELAFALGVPGSALDGANISLDLFERIPAATELDPDELRREALMSRSDVLVALAEYGASQSALQLEVAKQYPDIHLGPGYLWDEGQVKWSLGLSLVLPLFNRNEGPIAEADARRTQAAANFMATQARAAGEVEQALAGYRFTVQKLAAADATLTAQLKNDQSAAALYRAGESDRLAWLGAQLETTAADLARRETLIQAQQSVAALEDAVQRPLTPGALDLITAERSPRKDNSTK